MTAGEVIALLTQYCSDEDPLLMCIGIYSIDVHDNYIIVYTIDGNSPDVIIKRREE